MNKLMNGKVINPILSDKHLVAISMGSSSQIWREDIAVNKKATYSNWNWVATKLKRTWDLLITFSPILWIFFFLMLTVLVNRLGV